MIENTNPVASVGTTAELVYSQPQICSARLALFEEPNVCSLAKSLE